MRRILLTSLLTARFAFCWQLDPSLLEGMKYRLVGPFRGGRVLAVEGIAGDPDTFYFGAVAGGIWKTTDRGLNWKPLFEKESVSSIGSLAVAPSDPNVIYAGSGEGCLRGNISYGDGVYKSVDGGKTWKNMGLADSRHIPRILVHPRNPDLVYVAALGHAFGPNAERGVFRSTDGGRSWTKVLYHDDRSGAIALEFDPTNPNILFAALYQVQRQPHTFDSGGPGSGLYRSADGGLTWKKLEGNGLPAGILGRIGISISGADPDRIYALIEAEEGGLFRSDDGGQKWTRVNDDERYRQRAWYFSHVFADPKNADTVYVLNTGMFRSADAGKTFTLLPAPHGDHHGLWIDPVNPRRMINGNDGGATISVDGGKTWSPQSNQPTAQFYHVAADNRFPYYLFGAQQDNSSVAIASWSDSGIIEQRNWYLVGGGESAYLAPDPRDGNVVFAAGQGATRFDKRTEQTQDVSPMPIDFSGHGVEDFPHRFQWTEPILFSPHDPKVLYTAGEVVFRSTDEGRNWQVISPDLTRNDKSKQKSSGGPVTKDNTSVEYYDTIFALAESPVRKGVLWAGSDDGLIHISTDGGADWRNVTPKELPEWSLVSLIDASPHDAGTAYAAVDRHKLDDFRPYIYRTSDSGKTWASIATGIPEGAYVHVVREDPKKKGLLYAGTETGVFVSADDGAHWEKLQSNLPTTPVHDLVVKDDDLALATHGRSFWILDDLSPLRQANAGTAESAVTLFRPRAAWRVRFPDDANRRQPVGENPPSGAILYYWLKSAAKEEITLDILDQEGKLVRHYSSVKKKEEDQPTEWPDVQRPPDTIPAEAGLNRFAWDLRHDEPARIPGVFFEGDAPPKGPLALPGAYQVKLTAGGKSYTAALEIRQDPRVHVAAEDLRRQFELEAKIDERLNSLHNTVNRMRYLRSQMQVLSRRLGAGEQWAPLRASLAEFDKKLTAVEEQLLQTKMKSTEGDLRYPAMIDEQLIYLGYAVASADAAPTRGQEEVYQGLARRLEEQLRKWDELQSRDLPGVQRLIEKARLPLIDDSAKR